MTKEEIIRALTLVNFSGLKTGVSATPAPQVIL